ncbi:hypothetical protein C1Y31_06740 [Pseudomonas sp. FW305-25]|nr:hypothetical protein C1Y31_06740 [Pseudomonas sp. FW305-25]PMY73951.1 hypothetical protein C1Y32_05350 [Pseudomonas sp. FW126-L8]PNA82633.1 hypothetical protein C1Y33_03650 [Pseudomonas sp. FW305-76]
MQSLVRLPRALVFAALIAGSLAEHCIFFLHQKESLPNWLFIILTYLSCTSRKCSAQSHMFIHYKGTPLLQVWNFCR